jgi:glycosyltransferase involved in cell wall biosynthesis
VNVLFLSHMFPSALNPLAGIFVLEQMSALRELGTEIAVVSPKPWVPSLLRALPRGRKFYVLPRAEEVRGFPVARPRVLMLPRGRLFSLYGGSYFLGCLPALRRLVDQHRVQLIHAHAIMPDGFAGVLLGRALGLPVVCTIHGSDINLYPHRSRAAWLATRWALRRLDAIVTVSHRLRENVRALAGPVAAHVVPNGANSAKFAPRPRAEARRHLGLPADKAILLFAGNLIEVKGTALLIEALARLRRPDTLLYVVGEGHLKDRLVALAASLDVADAVRFVGRQPHDEMPLWLSAADCLVMPSLSEGFPTLLPEAMMCRVPIVATDVGGIPELLVHEARGWMVPRGDVAALVTGIETMLSRHERVAAMVDEAQQAALASYTWTANAEKMRSIYADTLRARPLGRPALSPRHSRGPE